MDKPISDMNVHVRKLDRQRDIINMLGDMIAPVTEGFEHINLDMSFSFLNKEDLAYVDTISGVIDICNIWGLRQSEYLARGKLATVLNSRRSKGAKTMQLFTEVTTHHKETFTDESDKKGFSLWGKKKRRIE